MTSSNEEIEEIEDSSTETGEIKQKAVSGESIFRFQNVSQVRHKQTILDDINLEIKEHSVTALIGPSGAGKTSLLRLLNRLDDPAGGQIFYRSRPLIDYPIRELRSQIGFVFQTPVMFPGTVADNLRKALELSGKSIVNSEAVVNEMLAMAELESSFAERDSAQLSVGQKQRVSIARALVTAPEVLLMDEPTSALDPETADKLIETIHKLGRERAITVVMITHRLTEAGRASDTTVFMERGRVIEAGPTGYIFGERTNPRIREFLKGAK